jgi:ABC-type Na+ efflux pump permease subunit
MSRTLSVAWRDFRQTVLRKIFLLAVIGVPILVVGAMAIAALVMIGHEEPPLVGTIAIAEASGELVGAARAEFDPARIAAEVAEQIQEMEEASREMLAGGAPPAFDPAAESTVRMGMGRGEVRVDLEEHREPGEQALRELRERVRSGALLALAVVGPDVLESPDPAADDDELPHYDLLVAEGVDVDHVSFIERRIGQAAVRVRAARAGLEAERVLAMLRPPSSATRRLLRSGEETSEDKGLREIRQQLVPMAFMMLLWIATFTSANHLMMSTIEEKSNRVMEVLLSAVSPFQLMAGKILGQGAVGLLIVLIYSSLGIASLAVFERMNFIEWWDIAYLFVFFFMAYFMIASIMAAVGSAVSDIREANTLVTPVMIVVTIPLLLWMPISQAPNGGLAAAFSFIPPAIPFVMILRLAADEAVPLWQIPATIVWGYACVLGMVWMAARIFRVGVLLYGKPPTPLQLLRWVRYA